MFDWVVITNFPELSRCRKDTWLFSARGRWISKRQSVHGKCHGHACSRWFPWTPRTSSWCSFRLLKLANLRADMRWHALLSAHFWTCRSSRLEGWCFTLFHRAYEVLELTCRWHVLWFHDIPSLTTKLRKPDPHSTWYEYMRWWRVYCVLFSPVFSPLVLVEAA